MPHDDGADLRAAWALTVGCIRDADADRRAPRVYAKDITYGTAKEIGFDFLRDRLRIGADAQERISPAEWPSVTGSARRNESPVQRGHYFALVDEGDSILIDEARTPLIIGLTQPNTAATVNLLRWSQRAAQRLDATSTSCTSRIAVRPISRTTAAAKCS